MDLQLLSNEASKNGLLDTLTDLLPATLRAIDREDAFPDQLLDAFDQPRLNRSEVQDSLTKAIKFHDETLVDTTN